MDYKSTYQAIINWAGINTQYWVAVDLLKAKNQLTPSEINLCDAGLSSKSAELVVFKISTLKALCLGSENEVIVIGRNDAAPDVSRGTATYQFQDNSNPTEVVMLDNAVVGSRITLEWKATVELPVIKNGTVFALNGNIEPVPGTKLVLEVVSPNHFEELYRFLS